MSHANTESTIAPKSAGKNPATVKPGTIHAIIQKRNALRTNEKSPSVRIVTGSVRMRKIGRINIVITDHTSAARSVASHPLEWIPGTRLIVRIIAATVPK